MRDLVWKKMTPWFFFLQVLGNSYSVCVWYKMPAYRWLVVVVVVKNLVSGLLLSVIETDDDVDDDNGYLQIN